MTERRHELVLRLISMVFVFASVVGPNERAFAQTLPTCSAEMFSNECPRLADAPLDLRKSTTEADGALFNYFAITQSERKAELKQFAKLPSYETKTRALSIAEDVRQSAIDYVTGGTPEASWSKDVARLVERLRTVGFRVANNESDCSNLGNPAIPNARYLAAEHMISICPSALQIPSAEIASLLAHEIGHTTSPCQMSKPLLKFTTATPAIGRCLLRVDPKDKASMELLGPGSTTVQLPASGYGLETSSTPAAELLRCGAAVRLGLPQLAPLAAYNVLTTCLAKEYGTGRDICASKSEEHFADSFGGFTFANFASKKEMSAAQITTAFHARRNIQCAEKELGRSLQLKTAYPPNRVRLMLQLKPQAIANRLSCTPSSEAVCSLSETTFAPTKTSAHPATSNGARTAK